MKKLFLIAIVLFGFSFISNAQDLSKNAIGLRLGDSNAFGAEVSYQRALGKANRLEFDLGWRNGRNYDGFKLAGLYHWVWNIDNGFNWYAGPGAGIGSFGYYYKGDHYNETFIFAAGDIGIEYNFDFPLQLSLDFRPEIGLGDSSYRNDDLNFDIGIGVRYKF